MFAGLLTGSRSCKRTAAHDVPIVLALQRPAWGAIVPMLVPKADLSREMQLTVQTRA